VVIIGRLIYWCILVSFVLGRQKVIYTNILILTGAYTLLILKYIRKYKEGVHGKVSVSSG